MLLLLLGPSHWARLLQSYSPLELGWGLRHGKSSPLPDWVEMFLGGSQGCLLQRGGLCRWPVKGKSLACSLQDYDKTPIGFGIAVFCIARDNARRALPVGGQAPGCCPLLLRAAGQPWCRHCPHMGGSWAISLRPKACIASSRLAPAPAPPLSPIRPPSAPRPCQGAVRALFRRAGAHGGAQHPSGQDLCSGGRRVRASTHCGSHAQPSSRVESSLTAFRHQTSTRCAALCER